MNANGNQRSARRMRKGRQNKSDGYGLLAMGKYTSISKPFITFLDPHQYVTLKYVENVHFSNTTGVGSQNIFNLNSIFDPNRTGTGHQPYGFDQLVALYNRYRVLRAKWKVTFGPTTNAAIVAVVVPVNGLLFAAITNATTFESACELPYARTIVIPNAGVSNNLTVRGNMSLNMLNGVTTTEYLADDRFESQVGSSPAEVITLYVGVYNPTTATVVNDVLVELDYEVDLHDPIVFTSS